MTKESTSWTLESLLDFEQASTSGAPTSQAARAAVIAATRGLTGAAARRRGLRVWLANSEELSAGRRFVAAISVVRAVLMLAMFLIGISAVVGMLDRELGGIHVTLFLAVLIGGQWLVLGLASVAWVMRRRAADGFSGVQSMLGHLTRRLAGARDAVWWRPLLESGGGARSVILWQFAGIAQAAGIAFNLGLASGLVGMVLVKNVGFFWETTTEVAMHSVLAQLVQILSVPWSTWWPEAVPSADVIAASRWLPGNKLSLDSGPAEWWQFLLMTILLWGVLPRALLLIVSHFAARKALLALDFQGRIHRILWREINGDMRVETEEKPLDGVLVLDVGGSGLREQDLRPFLLQRLRVHPAVWKPVAVLDSGAEQEAARSLADAPAGVVLLAEGWSLSPARMLALHGKVRASAGIDAPIKFLVANVGTDRRPAAATTDERREWTRFVDGLRDPAAEVFFYDPAHFP